MKISRALPRYPQPVNQAILLADAAHQAVCITDDQNRFIHVNRCFEVLYGRDVNSLRAKSPAILLSRRQDPAGAEVVASTTRSVGSWSGQIANQNDKGLEIWIDLRTQSIEGRRDKVVGMMAYARPVPEHPVALSPQQEKIFHLLGTGLVAKEIAARLDIQPSTVQTQVVRMCEKFNLHGLHDLTFKAIRCVSISSALTGSADFNGFEVA